MKRSLGRSLLVHAALLAATLVTFYPILWVAGLSLTARSSLEPRLWPLPAAPSLQNFSDLLAARDGAGHLTFARQLGNSVIVSLLTAGIGLSLSTSAAYALSRFRFRSRRALLQTLLGTQMFPATLMSVPLYTILDRLHLLNTLSGLVLVYATTAVPFSVWMLKGAFDALPREIEEAALLDGATPFQIYWRVLLPLVRPALAVTFLFSFMAAWNEFILAATFLDDPARFTLPVALARLVGEYHTDWGHFAAGALMVSMPVVGLFFVLQRQLVAGLTQGSVKG